MLATRRHSLDFPNNLSLFCSEPPSDYDPEVELSTVETADEHNEPGTAEESNANYSPAASLSSQVSLKISNKEFLDFFFVM
jgi:hypothetical protein